jgi:hypothetical protein
MRIWTLDEINSCQLHDHVGVLGKALHFHDFTLIDEKGRRRE